MQQIFLIGLVLGRNLDSWIFIFNGKKAWHVCLINVCLLTILPSNIEKSFYLFCCLQQFFSIVCLGNEILRWRQKSIFQIQKIWIKNCSLFKQYSCLKLQFFSVLPSVSDLKKNMNCSRLFIFISSFKLVQFGLLVHQTIQNILKNANTQKPEILGNWILLCCKENILIFAQQKKPDFFLIQWKAWKIVLFHSTLQILPPALVKSLLLFRAKV